MSDLMYFDSSFFIQEGDSQLKKKNTHKEFTKVRSESELFIGLKVDFSKQIEYFEKKKENR